MAGRDEGNPLLMDRVVEVVGLEDPPPIGTGIVSTFASRIADRPSRSAVCAISH
jgi:hypothetical protein